jgi:hypothetical protein
MTKLKIMFGLCAVSAIAICAFAAQSASAQTAYLCSQGSPTLVFEDAHCKTPTNIKANQKFGHTKITPNSDTPFILTNETTGEARSTAKVKSVQSGVTLELQATEVEGNGKFQNKEEGAVTWTEGTGTITFKNVTVTAPAGKGCKVTGGSITTKELKATTKGLTNQNKIEPGATAEGKFAEFTIEGCSIAALNHAYSVTGSVIGNTEGTTVIFTHAGVTAQGAFSIFGQKAGIEVSLTTKDETTGEGIAHT